MRLEPYGVGSFVHVVKRGARGLPFLKDEQDFHRTLLMLAHFNDAKSRPFWFRELVDENMVESFERPVSWGPKKPLVTVHSFCLHANHFHLLLEEITDGGVSLFMQKIGNGIAGYVNEKYSEYGSPFQGPYKSKTIDTDEYLRYVFAYIEVKNAFERYPSGYSNAAARFDDAYAWALSFPNSSLHDHLGRSDLPNNRGIVVDDVFSNLFGAKKFKKFAEDVIAGRAYLPVSQKVFKGAFV